MSVREETTRIVDADGVSLAVSDSGGGGRLGRPGRPIILLHGLTATRRYVVHGSHLLERAGYRVVSYDARGHGDSSPAPDPAAYRYQDLVRDLVALMDELAIDSAVLAGVSMGAATALALALEQPERVQALVQITPAYAGGGRLVGERAEGPRDWEALAAGLERDGMEGFVREYGQPPVSERFLGIVVRAIRQRVERHRHPQAVAAALRVVPRSRPFERIEELAEVRAPTLVVASRDEADPEHPYEVAVAYAERIPRAELISEEPGQSPLAWRGAQLSRATLAFLEQEGLGP